MKLHWLKLNRPTILEIPQLKDYAGQALVFKEPAFRMRCVTDDVFNNALVKAYRDQLLIIEVDGNGAVLTPAAAPSVVTEEPKAPAVPPAVDTPMREPEPSIPSVPEVEEGTKVTEPVSDSVSTEESPTKDTDENKGFELKRRRRS